VKLGISSYTFGWTVGVPGHAPAHPLDESGLLDKCRELGVKLLQIGDNLPLHEFDDGRLLRLASRAEREGVELEVGARRLTIERVSQYADIARRLHARLLRFVIDDFDYHPAEDEVVTVLQKSAAFIGGLTLGLENHDRFSCLTLSRLLEAAADPRIGICLDTANSLGAGECIDRVTDVLGQHTVNLHIKDFVVERLPHRMGFTVRGRPAGDGLLNIPRLVEQVSSWNKCKSAVLELWTPPQSTLEQTIARESAWAVQSIHYLKRFFS